MIIRPRSYKDFWMIALRKLNKETTEELDRKRMENEAQQIFEIEQKQKDNYVPFVSEVEEFNNSFGKPNNYTPTIPQEEWQSKFVYDFIAEENEELKEAYESKDIVGVLDAICDIVYVGLGNAAMLFGLKDKILPAYAEVQRSNISKLCYSQWEADKTIELRSKEQGEPCHSEQVGDKYIVYRTRDMKVMKSINYSKPDLLKLFSREELLNLSK